MPAKSQQRHHSDDEVLEWIERYQQDDQNEEVQMLLINRYSDLVEALARKFSRGRAIHDDLVQVGMIGLLAALRRFDPEFGRSFESFAVPTIIGEIKRFIRDKTWSVHVPRRIKELGPKIKKTVEELTTELQRSPRIDEIADHLGVSDEEILEYTNLIGRTQGIFAAPEGGATLAAFMNLRNSGWIKDSEKVVLFNTGSGHKYAHLWVK